MAPNPEGNEVDAQGQRSRQKLAKEILEAHSNGLQATRERDLVAEKLLLHIDGSGDFQWADIFRGTRVEIPRLISEFRKTENLLRPIVDNAVAHHTTMDLKFHAESQPDRRSREQALIDTVWANHLSQEQDFNGLFAEALYLAMPMGFCPVHRYWRDDGDHHHMAEPIGPASDEEHAFHAMTPGQGTIDCWVGNPWATVFDPAAKRNSIQWVTYDRVLPAEMVRQFWSHVPGVAGLEGSTRIPSASEFQRIARQWRHAGEGVHGTPIQDVRRGGKSADELITVVCREIRPGVDPRYPKGRLQIIAVPGEVDTRKGKGTAGHATLLADQPLPGADFSFTNFYSHHRGSDVRGKPWAEDLDQLQVDLNIMLSNAWEFTKKLMDAPMVAPGGAISDDMADLGGYNLMEVEPSLASWRPRVMEWSPSVLPALEKRAEELRRALYTIGGYQASSRGEAPGSRMAYRAIVALQEADKTIHGPVNARFQRSACDFMRGCWKQMKAYGDVPWLVSITGDEYSYLVDPYISKQHLSNRPPRYTLTNAFGPSPEMRAAEITELMQLQGADGEPFLSTEEARKLYPDQAVFDNAGNAGQVQRRRARTIATRIHKIAEDVRAQHGIQGMSMADPMVQQAGMHVFARVEQEHERMRDDDMEAHIESLSEITQDETADPIARVAARQRQELYYQWQASMAGAHLQGGQAQQAATGAVGGQAMGGPGGGGERRQIAAQSEPSPSGAEIGVGAG